MILYNDKKFNSPETYNNYKHIYTQQQNTQIYEANIDRTEGRNRQ